MIKTRVIPVLLLKGKGLVKTERFENPKYLGDPINIVKIFNEKEAHELVLLDIYATTENRPPQFNYIQDIASECFMPLGYGGGIKTLGHIKKILALGFEKVVLNSIAVENPEFVGQASDMFGSQSIVISIDVKKEPFGKYEVYIRNGKIATQRNSIDFAKQMEQMGAGEILLNSIDRDGTMSGYDIELIKSVSTSVSIPVLACGGASCLRDFSDAVKLGGASAVVAGSMFVFHGKHRAVLISFPDSERLKEYLE